MFASFSIASLIEAVKAAVASAMATVKGWFTSTTTETPTVTENGIAPAAGSDGIAGAAASAAAATATATPAAKNGGWWDSIKSGLTKVAEFGALPVQYLCKGVAKLAQALGLGELATSILSFCVFFGISLISPMLNLVILTSWFCHICTASSRVALVFAA